MMIVAELFVDKRVDVNQLFVTPLFYRALAVEKGYSVESIIPHSEDTLWKAESYWA